MRATAHTCGLANTSLWSNVTTDVGNKVAQTSANWLSKRSFQRQIMPQAAQSFGQPRPVSLLGLLSWLAIQALFST